MSVTVRNMSDYRRVWPDLQTVDGAVLVLDPGEEATLADDPEEVAHLRVTKTKTIDPTGGK